MLTKLSRFLEEHGISQAEFARGINKTPSAVSRFLSGEARPSFDTINDILAFLSARVGRTVSYEEALQETETQEHVA